MELKISIGIATYKRPDRLTNLLNHISRLKIPDNISVEMLIADNDANQSAKTVVEEHQQKNILPVSYLTQSIQNIALVRNTILQATTGDYLYFIDDDEYPDQDCLTNLLDTAIRFKADVVFGPVLAIFPENAPDWVLQGGLYNRQHFQTGTKKEFGGTGNTLIRCDFYKPLKLEFNPDFGLTGGEDTEFFSHFNKLGATMVWCDEAIVYEPVAPERLKVSWLLKRSYRSGQVFAKIFYGHLNAVFKVLIFFKRFGLLLLAMLYVVAVSCCGKGYRIKALKKVASCLGQLTGFTKWSFQEYRDVSS